MNHHHLSQHNDDLQLLVDQLQFLFHELGCCNYLSFYTSLKNFCGSSDFSFVSKSFCAERISTMQELFLVFILFQEIYPDLLISIMDSRVAKVIHQAPSSSSSSSSSSSQYEFIIKMTGIKILPISSFPSFLMKIIQNHLDDFQSFFQSNSSSLLLSESFLLTQITQKLLQTHYQIHPHMVSISSPSLTSFSSSSCSSASMDYNENQTKELSLLSSTSSDTLKEGRETATKKMKNIPENIPKEEAAYLSLVYDIYFIEISIVLHPQTKRMQCWQMEILDHHSF